MDRDGRLGADTMVLAGGEFSAGDRVPFRHNATRLGVVNGQRGEVLAVDADTQRMTVAFDGRAVALDRDYLSGAGTRGSPPSSTATPPPLIWLRA